MTSFPLSLELHCTRCIAFKKRIEHVAEDVIGRDHIEEGQRGAQLQCIDKTSRNTNEIFTLMRQYGNNDLMQKRSVATNEVS